MSTKTDNQSTPISARGSRRVLMGLVVSNKMQKTIVVKVDRRVLHPMYGKTVTISKNYKVHDEKGEAHTGDRVEIIQTRPISKHKCWALRKVVIRSTLEQA
jgi:small subunit ribosomal protein S17